MTQQWALSVQIPSSQRGTGRPSHRPALGEAFVLQPWAASWGGAKGQVAELQGPLESLPRTLDPRALWSVPPSL